MNQLDIGYQLQSNGIKSVSRNNETFLEIMRAKAKAIIELKGKVTADDLREWADIYGIIPTHQNAWGAVFVPKEFVCVGRVTSRRPERHCSEIRVWALA